MKITKGELFEKLSSLKGTSIVTCSIDTPVKLTKENPFGSVRLEQSLNGIIGFNYLNSINNLEKKEGIETLTEETHPRKWGKLTENRVCVTHTPKGETTEKYYLQLKVQGKVHKDENVYYNETGVVSKEDILPYFPEKKKVSTQQHLEGEVIVRDISFDNIKTIKMNGETYEIEG